jgi:transposase
MYAVNFLGERDCFRPNFQALIEGHFWEKGLCTTYKPFLDSDTKTNSYKNNPQGFQKFLKEHRDFLPRSLVVLETTGGHESACLNFLLDRNIAVHRADTRKVKNFIRSFGQNAKTDELDARALALYACERQDRLNLYQKTDETHDEIRLLVERRQDLNKMLTQEKNRFQAPLNRPLLSKMVSPKRFIDLVLVKNFYAMLR